MKRVIIKLNDGTYINIEGDHIQTETDGYITAWNGDEMVAIVKAELIQIAYISRVATEEKSK